jgi:two-component system chemotaxis response regulator CheB
VSQAKSFERTAANPNAPQRPLAICMRFQGAGDTTENSGRDIKIRRAGKLIREAAWCCFSAGNGILQSKAMINSMDTRNIIVIGTSAGGFTALQRLVAMLPADLPAAVFIVWHMSPDMQGILPGVLNKLHTLPALHAVDFEPIQMGRIYVAPPDRHLLLEKDHVRITRGPKENRFRPAVDPLFRSAAYVHGARVIGVVLSGGLDDGSAGLWTIKDRGGLAVVQDPLDAEVPSMPENALRAVQVDYKVPVTDMAALLTELVAEPVNPLIITTMDEQEKTRREVNIALGENALDNNLADFTAFSPYTCPECHGVLSAMKEGELMRYRCHTGHAFSTDSLLANITEKTEESLWSAMRSIQESVMLLNHMGDHFAEANQPKLAATYFKKAKEAEERATAVRKVVEDHEQLSKDQLEYQAQRSARAAS